MTTRFEVGKTYGLGNSFDVLITGRTAKTVSCVFLGKTYTKKRIEFSPEWDAEKGDFVETDIEMLCFNSEDIVTKATELLEVE